MATGPLTQITDLVVPEIFTPYVQQLTEEKSRLIQSGATTVNPILSNFLSGGGLTVDVPSFKDLDNEEENIPTDDPADSIIASYQGGTPTDANRKDSVPKKTGTSTEIAVRISRNQSWSAADLAADLAGADPMGSIASRVAKYWALRFQAIFVATTNGIIKANVAANGGDFQNDVSGAAFADGVTNFSAEAFIDAAATMGDSSDDLSLMMTHSVVMARMKKNKVSRQEQSPGLPECKDFFDRHPGVGFGSLSLDDLALPEGDVIVLGIVANLSFTSEDANIAATWSGDFSIGTKATIDADLVDDDEANLLPSTAIGPAVADVIASARYAAVPVEAAQILELDAPEPLKINMLVDAANITDASTGVISVSGDVSVAFVKLGG
jgi:hypothetical protein